jgi:hypothetical protein
MRKIAAAAFLEAEEAVGSVVAAAASKAAGPSEEAASVLTQTRVPPRLTWERAASPEPLRQASAAKASRQNQP